MKKIIRAFRGEALWILLLTVCSYTLSYYPIYRNYQTVPDDYVYIGSINYPLDMLGQMIYARSGYIGHWIRYPKITSTIRGIGSIFRFEYILIGQTARMLGMDLLTWMHLTKVFVSIFLLLCVYYSIQHVFSKKALRISAYMLVLFSGSMVFPRSDLTWPKVNAFMYGMAGDALISIRSTTAAHHYMIGNILVFFSLLLLYRALDRKSVPLVFASVLPGMMCIIINAPAMMMMLLSFPFVVLIYVFRGITKKQGVMEALHIGGLLFIYVSFVGFAMLYSTYVYMHWDFNTMEHTEKIVPFTLSSYEYPFLVGMVYICALFAIPYIVKRGKTFWVLLVPWIIVHPIGLYVVSPLLGINQLRFLLGPYYIGFALLGALGIQQVSTFLSKFLRIPGSIVISGLSLGVVLSSAGMIGPVLSQNTACFCLRQGESDYGYPRRDIMNAIAWLEANTEENDIVLSGNYAGTLIISFAGNYTYTTWWYRLAEPPSYNPAYYRVQSFFSGNLTETQVERFLRENDISYVFFSLEEQAIANGKSGLSYSMLSPVFQDSSIIVYEVHPEKNTLTPADRD